MRSFRVSTIGHDRAADAGRAVDLRSSAFSEPGVLLPWALHLSALLQSVHEAVESHVREFHLRLLR